MAACTAVGVVPAQGHLEEEQVEAETQPVHCSPRCGPWPRAGPAKRKGYLWLFSQKCPTDRGGPDSRGEVSRETLSAEVSLQRPDGASALAWVCIVTRGAWSRNTAWGQDWGEMT